MSNTSTIVYESITAKLRELLLAGNFPEVQYNEGPYSKSYAMMEYSMVNSKASTLVHKELQEKGYPKGIFSTRLRSKKFQTDVKASVDALTPERINGVMNRLRTWAD